MITTTSLDTLSKKRLLIINFLRDQQKLKNPNPEEFQYWDFIFKKVFSYFKPAILCSIVAIFAKASASFCFSFANTFSGAPATNFSLDNFA